MKLEAVILAAGSGSRMVELTRARPKCLLPVGNQSLIWFAIAGLKSIGINRIIILVPDAHETEIKQYCHKKFSCFKELDLDFINIPTKADCGTAESILVIKDRICGDFIVHSCDTIIDPKALSYLVNHYRLYDPMLSMLLSNDSKYFLPRSVPGRRDKEQATRDVIANEPLDKLDLTLSEGFSASKIVFLQSERELKQKLRIKNRELAMHPSLEVSSCYLDAHVYIFKHQMLNFMSQYTDVAVLKGEMIPLLISKQFTRLSQNNLRDALDDDDDKVAKNRVFENHFDYEKELNEILESFSPRNVIQSTHFRRSNVPQPLTCHAIIFNNMINYRVNTLGSYLDSNREAKVILNIFGLKNITSMKECVLGESTTYGDKCTFKKGSIGNNCKIGDKVKLYDCVIMDNVEIGSNSSLCECIVGSASKIGPKCELKSCIIGYKQVVLGPKKAVSEVLIDDGYVIDLSDPIIMDNE